MDQRDAPTWIAIELTRLGETKVEDGTLIPSLFADLGVPDDFPVFIPAVTYAKGHKTITVHLVEGYVFVSSVLNETTYFALERRPYVAQVLSTVDRKNGMRVPSVISDKHIEEMKNKLRMLVVSDVEHGATVKIVDGRYRGLEGAVIGFEKDCAFVVIELRSLHVITAVPRVFLEVQ